MSIQHSMLGSEQLEPRQDISSYRKESYGFGVSLDSRQREKSFKVRIYLKGAVLNLGRYSNAHEARLAHDQAAMALHNARQLDDWRFKTNYVVGSYPLENPDVQRKIGEFLAFGTPELDCDGMASQDGAGSGFQAASPGQSHFISIGTSDGGSCHHGNEASDAAAVCQRPQVLALTTDRSGSLKPAAATAGTDSTSAVHQPAAALLADAASAALIEDQLYAGLLGFIGSDTLPEADQQPASGFALTTAQQTVLEPSAAALTQAVMPIPRDQATQHIGSLQKRPRAAPAALLAAYKSSRAGTASPRAAAAHPAIPQNNCNSSCSPSPQPQQHNTSHWSQQQEQQRAAHLPLWTAGDMVSISRAGSSSTATRTSSLHLGLGFPVASLPAVAALAANAGDLPGMPMDCGPQPVSSNSLGALCDDLCAELAPDTVIQGGFGADLSFFTPSVVPQIQQPARFDDIMPAQVTYRNAEIPTLAVQPDCSRLPQQPAATDSPQQALTVAQQLQQHSWGQCSPAGAATAPGPAASQACYRSLAGISSRSGLLEFVSTAVCALLNLNLHLGAGSNACAGLDMMKWILTYRQAATNASVTSKAPMHMVMQLANLLTFANCNSCSRGAINAQFVERSLALLVLDKLVFRLMQLGDLIQRTTDESLSTVLGTWAADPQQATDTRESLLVQQLVSLLLA